MLLTSLATRCEIGCSSRLATGVFGRVIGGKLHPPIVDRSCKKRAMRLRDALRGCGNRLQAPGPKSGPVLSIACAAAKLSCELCCALLCFSRALSRTCEVRGPAWLRTFGGSQSGLLCHTPTLLCSRSTTNGLRSRSNASPPRLGRGLGSQTETSFSVLAPLFEEDSSDSTPVLHPFTCPCHMIGRKLRGSLTASERPIICETNLVQNTTFRSL